eukprot:m.80714 g.80714  ORF g.80714 m.80714 type:complete len:109 (+) comp25342_c0_seq2:187-513(+)
MAKNTRNNNCFVQGMPVCKIGGLMKTIGIVDIVIVTVMKMLVLMVMLKVTLILIDVVDVDADASIEVDVDVDEAYSGSVFVLYCCHDAFNHQPSTINQLSTINHQPCF